MDFLVLSDIHESWDHLDKMLEMAKQMDGVIFLGDLMKFREVNTESMNQFKEIADASNWMVAVPGNGPLPVVVDFISEIGVSIHGLGRQLGDLGFLGVGGIPDTISLISQVRAFYREGGKAKFNPNSLHLTWLNDFGIRYEKGGFIVDEWTEADYAQVERYRSPFEFPEAKIHELLNRAHKHVVKSPRRILLTHIPPYDETLFARARSDIPTGSKAIARFIRENQPDLVLSGHYHEHLSFDMNGVSCVVVPAVVDGYYCIMTYDDATGRFDVDGRSFE